VSPAAGTVLLDLTCGAGEMLARRHAIITLTGIGEDISTLFIGSARARAGRAWCRAEPLSASIKLFLSHSYAAICPDGIVPEMAQGPPIRARLQFRRHRYPHPTQPSLPWPRFLGN
jgi:hypothetical protein